MGGRAVGCRERAFFFPDDRSRCTNAERENASPPASNSPPTRRWPAREAASAMAEQRVSTVVFALLQYL